VTNTNPLGQTRVTVLSERTVIDAPTLEQGEYVGLGATATRDDSDYDRFEDTLSKLAQVPKSEVDAEREKS